MNKLNKSNRKLSNAETSKRFLLECRKDVIPRFISDSCKQTSNLLKNGFTDATRANNIVKSFQTKILDLIIDGQNNKVQFLLRQINNCKTKLSQCSLSPNLKLELVDIENKLLRLNRLTNNERNKKKLSRLKQNLFDEYNIRPKEKWFVNLTQTEFPMEIKWLLSLGGKFATPVDAVNFPLFTIIADVENCLFPIEDEQEKEIIRARITNVIMNTRFPQYRGIDRLINHIKTDSVKFLKQHKDIIILKADKGGATVAMYKHEYEYKMWSLLRDNNTYKEVKRNPLKRLEGQSNTFIRTLAELKVLDEVARKRLTRHNRVLPRIYALPKVHKADTPLRPIVSYIDSPAEDIAKMLSSILKQAIDDKYDVKNSSEVVKRIEGLTIEENEELVSFDIVSLFPSIPIKHAIDLVDEIWDDIAKLTLIPKDLFFKMLIFVLQEATFFTYLGTIFQQIDGSAMGSNISPPIAKLVVNKGLGKVCHLFPSELKLFMNYVDDFLAIIPKDEIDKVHECLNSFHPRIQFTVEHENNKCIPFLDVLIINDNGKVTFDWYQKPVTTGRVLSFLSHHPRHQIINTAENLIRRVFGLSAEKFHRTNENKIKSILRENNFPEPIISRLLNKHHHKNNDSVSPSNDNDSSLPNNGPTQTRIIRRKLTYVKSTSERIAKIIKSQKSPNVILPAFKPSEQLHNTVFSKLKQKVPRLETTNCVYEIPCKDCPETYVGQTKNELKVRIGQHVNDLNKPAKENGNTAIVSHFETLGHIPMFDKVKVLAREAALGKRLTLESLHIASNNTYNFRRDTEGTSASYRALLADFSIDRAAKPRRPITT